MLSFLGGLLFFLTLVIASSIMQRRNNGPRRGRVEKARVEQEIAQAAEIAQRRHRARFGADDTGLHRTMSAPASRKRGKVHP